MNIKKFFDSCSLPVNKNSQKNAKKFPARNIISHLGSSRKALASFLIPLIQPLVHACDYTCKNSIEFVQSLREIFLKDDEYLVSFDAEALLPSISLQKGITSINKELKKIHIPINEQVSEPMISMII